MGEKGKEEEERISISLKPTIQERKMSYHFQTRERGILNKEGADRPQPEERKEKKGRNGKGQ